jgi:hypothetical protein
MLTGRQRAIDNDQYVNRPKVIYEQTVVKEKPLIVMTSGSIWCHSVPAFRLWQAKERSFTENSFFPDGDTE